MVTGAPNLLVNELVLIKSIFKAVSTKIIMKGEVIIRHITEEATNLLKNTQLRKFRLGTTS